MVIKKTKNNLKSLTMKKLVLSIALVGFSTFALAQQTQNAQAQDNTRQDWSKMQNHHVNKMQQELGLSDAQVAQLKALHEKRKTQMHADKGNKDQMKADRKAWKDQNDADMKAILTPEQYTKWQNNRAEKMKNRMEMRKNKMDNGMKSKMQNSNSATAEAK